jgi:TrmH family RNA methyltransferase
MHRMERVSSRQNAVVKRFRELARARHARAESAAGREAEILLDGEHLVQEALAAGVPVDIAAFSERQVQDAESPLAGLAKEVRKRGGRPLIVTDQILAAMSPVQHPSGVVAIAHPQPVDLARIFRHLSAVDRVPSGSQPTPSLIVVVLAGVQDPGNVGAIVRAADAFGAAGVIAVEGSANPFSWKALRGAMGGTFRIPVLETATLDAVLAAAADHHVRVIAAVPRGGTPLPEIDLRTPAAIVLGGEGAGVPAGAVAAAHETVTIPMRAPVESLNVAAAAALILYEAARQRGQASMPNPE